MAAVTRLMESRGPFISENGWSAVLKVRDHVRTILDQDVAFILWIYWSKRWSQVHQRLGCPDSIYLRCCKGTSIEFKEIVSKLKTSNMFGSGLFVSAILTFVDPLCWSIVCVCVCVPYPSHTSACNNLYITSLLHTNRRLVMSVNLLCPCQKIYFKSI